MTEQIWLTNVKHLWLSLNTSWELVFCIDSLVCINSEVTGINTKTEICLPKKEYITGHR